ncbi:MAG: ferredoxin [Synergistaceae bacterium]|jgi:ferredoxin|nr:ferredoxin [Synergistaceae bacterium]
MRVSIRTEECIGCGVCAQICPEVFSMDDDAGVSRVIQPEGSDCAQEAADSCPVACIDIED